ncbi:MAG: efflux RND transporter periplasmic adaptor subunit [Undibacterium sp.]|nr:efflux RND transporter periplasmic adaptor subunit [Undibacterium sp.]
MKKRDLLLHACLTLAVALSGNASAAERPARFAVAEKQMRSLGIELAALQGQGAPIVMRLPAQVIVPPNREQIISSSLAGLPVQLFVQQNQQVKQGAPLLRIVSAEFGQLQLQLMQANSRATLARQAAQRERALLDEGIIAQRRVEETQASLKESEAALAQAKAALRLAGVSAAAIARIASSGQPDDGLTLYATQSGVITEIDVKLGLRVEPSTALMRIAQTQRLWLEIQAPATDVGNWKIGSQLKLQGRDIRARIVSISPVVTTNSQTIAIRADIDGSANDLRPGELLAVDMPVTASADSWDVPLAAVAHEGKLAYVFLRTADGFEARPVKVIASAGQRVRIQGALKPDDKIAVTGIVALKGSWLGEKGGS